MKTCPRCGAQYPDEFLFCSADASSLTRMAAPSPTPSLVSPVDAGTTATSALSSLSRVGVVSRPDRARLLLTSVMVACALGAVLSLVSIFRSISQRQVQPLAVAAPPTPVAPATAAEVAAPQPAPSATRDPKWQSVEFEEYGFWLEVPTGWRAEPVVRQADLVRWRFVSPESRWVYLVVDIDPQRHGVPAMAVWRNLDSRMERGFGERYTSLGITEAALGGTPGALWTMRNQKQGEPELMKADIGINLEDGKGLAVMLAAPPGSFERYRPVFDHAVASFYWSDPGE